MSSSPGTDRSLLVSAVECVGDDLEHVRHLGPEIRAHAGSITVPVQANLPSNWHLAFFHSRGRIEAFGIGQRAKRVSDLDARFNLRCARQLSHPAPLTQFRFSLGKVLQDGATNGTLPEQSVQPFLALFARANSSEASDLAEYRSWIEGQNLTGTRATQLGVEKDVLLTLFDIANLNRGVLTQWSTEDLGRDDSAFLQGLTSNLPSVVPIARRAVSEAESSFEADEGFPLASAPLPTPTGRSLDPSAEAVALQAVGLDPFPQLGGYSVLEDNLIFADMMRIPGLKYALELEPHGIRYAEWHRFQNESGSQVLHVMNANRGRVEREAGVDLVYYNQSHASYVCVQYKVMEQHPVNGWEHRPRKGLRKELRRMEKLDADYGDSGSSFDHRLYPLAGFVKLCQQDAIQPASTRMTEGMYSPRPRCVHCCANSISDR